MSLPVLDSGFGPVFCSLRTLPDLLAVVFAAAAVEIAVLLLHAFAFSMIAILKLGLALAAAEFECRVDFPAHRSLSGRYGLAIDNAYR